MERGERYRGKVVVLVAVASAILVIAGIVLVAYGIPDGVLAILTGIVVAAYDWLILRRK